MATTSPSSTAAGPATSFPGEGVALLAATRSQGLEGVVAKRLHSPYLPGKRTRSWLKVKHYQRETFLVGGCLPDRDQVRSLLVDHGLVPVARRWVRELLAPLVVAESPFAGPPASLLGGPWTRPGPDDPGPGVRPPRAGRGGQLPRLGVRPATPPCLQRPQPDTVGSPDSTGGTA
jgi:ATP dependent DNA ligase domain